MKVLFTVTFICFGAMFICMFAPKKQTPPPPIYYDYYINVHNDTAWLYTEDNKLIRRGDFDSIPQFIELDNL